MSTLLSTVDDLITFIDQTGDNIEFFSLEGISEQLIEYLDCNTILSLYDSNICKWTDILIKHLFRLYLNQWMTRNTKYGFDDEWVESNMTKWGRLGNQFVPNYSMTPIYSIINIDCITLNKDINNNDNDDDNPKMIDILSTMLHHNDEYCDYAIPDYIFQDINCVYSIKNRKWEYNILDDETNYDNHKIDYDKNRESEISHLISESKYEFNGNEFELLLQILLNHQAWKQVAIDRLCNLFDVKRNKFVNKYFIKKWYLQIIDFSKEPTKHIFVIYAEIDRNVIPKDYMNAYEMHKSKPIYDKNTITFLVFHLCFMSD